MFETLARYVPVVPLLVLVIAGSASVAGAALLSVRFPLGYVRFRLRAGARWTVGLGALGLALSAAVAWAAWFTHPGSYLPLLAVWLVSIALAIASAQQARRAAWRLRITRAFAIEAAIISSLVAAALLLRLVRLGSVPMVFGEDEASTAMAALRFTNGVDRNMFGIEFGGHPAMFFFSQSLVMHLFGGGIFAMRAYAALLGALSIGAVYLLGREMFGRSVGIVAAVLVGFWHIHLHYTRIGLNNAGDTLVMASSLFLLYRGVKRNDPLALCGAGIAAGLGFFLFPGSRIIPLIIAVFAGYRLLDLKVWRNHAPKLRWLRETGWIGLGYVVTTLPLWVAFLEQPGKFDERWSIVSIFDSGWIERQREATGDGTAMVLVDQVTRAFGGFFHYPDLAPTYGSSIPYLDAFFALFFFVGILFAVLRVREAAPFLLITSFGLVVFLGGALTINPPVSSRVIGAIPAVAVLAALGLSRAVSLVSGRQAVAAVVVGLLIVPSAFFNLKFYFGDFADYPYMSGINGLTQMEVVDYVRESDFSQDTRIYWYGAPRVYANQPIIEYLLRDRPPEINVPEDSAVAPPDEPAPAVFLFMPHRAKEMDAVREACPGGEVDALVWKRLTLAQAYVVRARNLCHPVAGSTNVRVG